MAPDSLAQTCINDQASTQANNNPSGLALPDTQLRQHETKEEARRAPQPPSPVVPRDDANAGQQQHSALAQAHALIRTVQEQQQRRQCQHEYRTQTPSPQLASSETRFLFHHPPSPQHSQSQDEHEQQRHHEEPVHSQNRDQEQSQPATQQQENTRPPILQLRRIANPASGVCYRPFRTPYPQWNVLPGHYGNDRRRVSGRHEPARLREARRLARESAQAAIATRANRNNMTDSSSSNTITTSTDNHVQPQQGEQAPVSPPTPTLARLYTSYLLDPQACIPYWQHRFIPKNMRVGDNMYRRASYPRTLADEGVYLDDRDVAVDEQGWDFIEALMNPRTPQELAAASEAGRIVNADEFEELVDSVQQTMIEVGDSHDARKQWNHVVFSTITPLVCPSVDLVSPPHGDEDDDGEGEYQAQNQQQRQQQEFLNLLAGLVEEPWDIAPSLGGPSPRPFYACGFRKRVFNTTMLTNAMKKLDECTGYNYSTIFGVTSSSSSPSSSATTSDNTDATLVGEHNNRHQDGNDCIFPFLAVEVGARNGLDVADLRNAQTLAMAMRAVVELYSLCGSACQLSGQIIAFSVSHDAEDVRIWGHFPIINDQDDDGNQADSMQFGRMPLYEGRLMADEDGDYDPNGDGEYLFKPYDFISRLYSTWAPVHLANLQDAMGHLYQRCGV
ncbi:hypothetical protein N3K66_000849 [Trichothecium roseum]|uniref:Uncharacterized protein n=1 Tax=Trichothecium roseum TaxID=47278 RepID=A0ACC0VEQ6_9HYPO|nr:hypothetical protein N3K66_000849 [Trichothecium roseum]